MVEQSSGKEEQSRDWEDQSNGLEEESSVWERLSICREEQSRGRAIKGNQVAKKNNRGAGKRILSEERS